MQSLLTQNKSLATNVFPPYIHGNQ